MARTFRRPSHAQPIAELNVTNLIDLGFTLLIIFMAASSLMNQQQSIPINLPVASSKPQTAEDRNARTVTISVDSRGYFVGDDKTPVGKEELRSRLAQFAAEPRPPVISINGDAGASYQKFITLMSELQNAGLTKVHFATKPEE